MFFRPHAKLTDEFDRLFNSVFANPSRIKSIVELLAERRMGYTRSDISNRLGISNNGQLSYDLEALISSDFVVKYVPFGYSGKHEHYKLIDPFCLFYIHFLKKGKKRSVGFWEENLYSGRVTSWRGFSFENVCFNHIAQIKHALSIMGVDSSQSAWSPKNDDGADGMQIDMLIDRADSIVNLCEIKFCSDEFVPDKEFYLTMVHRKNEVAKMVPRKKAVRNTLITTYGMRNNEYAGVIANVITIDDLFKDI